MLPRFLFRTLALALALALPSAARAQRQRSFTSPPGGDTTGYWQQGIRYRIVATLDDVRGIVRASGRLTYVNRSPDTLRVLYFHQYLNAFRPGSAWSRADDREGRVRFQHLADPAYGYERFTALPAVNGVEVTPEYPGAPDSTVVRIALPRPLPTGDSLEVALAWEARPSTVLRRQGRRGRTLDLAQWYPKVAVYDRGGWQPNPLVPAGEFYGEFGEYDVTLLLPLDQVVAATGVPVQGDPGWERVKAWGTVYRQEHAYDVAPAGVEVPAGMRAVRFVARDVHHFAWSVSPDYRYEGGALIRRPSRATRFPTWDTVAVHVLYKAGDEPTWGHGQVVERTIQAMRWLERIYGPYAYPQVTNLHRLEGGGTEFPMLMMNGSPALGLILHEGGHIFTYGILANNEWQSGWMDEGLTSFQTAWAMGDLPQERAGAPAPPAPRLPGYRGLAERPSPAERADIERYRVDLLGRAEPIGTRADLFNEFGIYNGAIYTRAQAMFGALRDVIGDSAFAGFLHLYYDRWALRHVDEAAMRRAAEDASGQDLRWFFDQWVRRVGLVDYSLKDVRTRRDGAGWLTTARVVKRGEYFHPMRVGVRTDSGWSTVRVEDPLAWSQVVQVHTALPPRQVLLDPYRVGDDWYGPNDKPHVPGPLQSLKGKTVFDWPFLEQANAYRILNEITPIAWYGAPGGITTGIRIRTNYQGWVNRTQMGVAFTARQPDEPPNPSWIGLHVRHVDPLDRLQVWAVSDDARLPWQPRPTIGLHMGAWALDGILKLDASKSWDLSRFLYAAGPRRSLELGYSGAYPIVHSMLDPVRWSGLSTNEVWAGYSASRPVPRELRSVTVRAAAGYASGRPTREFSRDGYARVEGLAMLSAGDTSSRFFARGRAYAAYSRQAPAERAVYLGIENAIATFGNHYLRPDGSPLARARSHYQPLGGAGFRGAVAFTPVEKVAAVNAEADARLVRAGPPARPLAVLLAGWANAGAAETGRVQAGAGLVVRGHLFDRPVRMRVDYPVVGENGSRFDRRWSFSFGDLW